MPSHAAAVNLHTQLDVLPADQRFAPPGLRRATQSYLPPRKKGRWWVEAIVPKVCAIGNPEVTAPKYAREGRKRRSALPALSTR